MLLRYCFLGLLVFSLFGCETEVDLNAPYENYTTVYGLIDLSSDTQVVRVNKAFLGAGSAFDFAMINDSSEYHPDDVEVFIEFGNQSVELEPHYTDRQPGVFYDENVLVYITTENLSVDAQGNPIDVNSLYNQLPDNYKLIVKVGGKTITGSAEATYLRASHSVSDPNPNIPSLAWGSVNANGDNFLLKKMAMKSVPPGERYEARIVFHYRDHYTDGTSAAQSFEFPLGSHSIPVGNLEQTFQMDYSPESIFNTIANNVDCSGVSHRTLEDTEFIMLVAGADLSRYITVNNPVTGIVTERPEYSNIEGENTIGLFSSRYKLSVFKPFNGNTREMLFTGETTGHLCFCDDSPGSLFPCPDNSSECDCN